MMKRAVEDLLRGEFIGRDVRIGNTTGTIIDETKHTFVVKTENGRKTYLKRTTTFEFIIEGKRVHIKGSLLAMKPEQRITLKLR